MADVANGDTAAIKALYSHRCDATSIYGWGGYEKSWAAGRERQAEAAGDLRPGQALPAQPLDRGGDVEGQLAGRPAGRRAAVVEGRRAARPPPCQPLAHRPLADPELGGDAACRLLLVKYAADHQPSTVRRRAGILMDVHPGLRLAG
jgi:hypothetical protein